jgi:hypothetical protein
VEFRSIGNEVSVGDTLIINVGNGLQCYVVGDNLTSTFTFDFTISQLLLGNECGESTCNSYCPSPTPTGTAAVTSTPASTPTPSPTSNFDYYQSTLIDCCTSGGTESVKFKVPQGSPISDGNVIYIDFGFGLNCYLLLSVIPISPAIANTIIQIYGECEECIGATGGCPTPTPTPTISLTPTRTPSPTPPVTQTRTPSATPPVTQTKTPTVTPTKTSTPPVTPTRTASPVPITFEYYEVYEIPSASCVQADRFVMRTTNTYIIGRYFNNGTCYEITGTEIGPSFNFNYNGSTFVGCSGCFT